MVGRVLPRSRFKRIALIIGLFVVAVVVAAIVLFYRAITPPSPGAFYALPDPLPNGMPGDIIRSERITRYVPDGAIAWRVLYLSTDSQDNPIAVSGVVIAPLAEADSPRPVIAWAQGTQGVRPACGTSHRNDPFEFISGLDLMVKQGFVVTATDYPGRGTAGVHPYLVGEVEARSVLDSVRVTRHLDINAGDRYAIWGGSQGGHAALWAAERSPTYASELDLVAVAAQAAATDLAAIFDALLEERIGGALLSQAMYAWSHYYPEANLDDVVLADRRDEVEALARTCLTTPLAFLTVNLMAPSVFLKADPLTLEPWRSIMEANIATGHVDAPLLISHRTADPVIPFDMSVREAEWRCADGQEVTLGRVCKITTTPECRQW